MDISAETTKLKELVGGAKDILIVTHEHPTFDAIGSSLALSLGLVSLGKRVTVACPDPMIVELSNFVGANKVVTDISKKNFVISLDYTEGSIEKVSYNIEGNTFNLVIEPRAGFPPFSEQKVHYSHQGGAADLIFAIDTIHLGGLKKLYEEEKELFATKPIVAIDRHPNNVHFGQINIVDGQASSTAELVGSVLQSLGAHLSEDIATNLLNALYGGTNNFANPNVTAGAFMLAASCVKAGGKRFRRLAGEDAHTVEPTIVPPPADTISHGDTSVPTSVPSASDVPAQAAPADWLKPKIFKSSNPL